jgi:tetratricopeptide (TPR) repeat protein
MERMRSIGRRSGRLLAGAAACAALAACRCGDGGADRPRGPAAGGERPAEVPITTASEAALGLYLEGRELNENLRGTEARRYFENAAARDPDFAMAHFGLALTAPSAQEFFARLERAVGLADRVSDGEGWIIRGLDAGVRSAPAEQERLYTQLVEAYPDDARAQTLLGELHSGRQEWEKAIARYLRAIEIAPDFPPPYNQLGYAYRALGRWDDAGRAFKKYIALVPGEPNPHDSYAELLMKTGRFEESIFNYRKALSIDDAFFPSHVGIGLNQIFLGKPDEARATFDHLYRIARNDGERREALLWTAASHLYQGDHDRALAVARKRAAIAEATGDLATLAFDQTLFGDLLLDAGRPREALAEYEHAVELIERAGVSAEVEAAVRRNHLYARARVALAEGDLAAARAQAAAYEAAVEVAAVPGELRQAHELAGRLALARGDAATALAELDHANRQDPRVLYAQALAARAAGDLPRARDLAAQAAGFNGLGLPYAYVRAKARALVEELG